MYKHILYAADLSGDHDKIADKAAELATLFGAKLSLVHAVEYVPVVANAYIPDMEIVEELKKSAEQQLLQLAKHLEVPEQDQAVVLGKARAAVLEQADNIHADLIVVGKRSHHGLEKLLGSTANGVLHGAHCDVLTLMVDEKTK